MGCGSEVQVSDNCKHAIAVRSKACNCFTFLCFAFASCPLRMFGHLKTNEGTEIIT